ncbi:MAG: hypothetical protein PVJ39_11270 [Gammaproteobacteria bacterium]
MKQQVISPWLQILCIGVLLPGLSACGVDTQKTAPQNTTTTINDVAMFGDAAVDTNPDDTIVHVEIPMDKNARVDALFNVTWDVTSSDPYEVTTYISDDSSLDETVDQLFFTTKCGTDGTHPCTSLADKLCGFNYQPEYQLDSDGNVVTQPDPNDANIQIPVVEADHYYVNCLNQFIEITDRVSTSGFPNTPFNNQYIIFQACNGAGDSCKTSSFQFDIVDSIP